MRRGLLVAALAAALCACGAGAPPYAECVDDLDCGAPSDACYEVRLTRSDGSDSEGAFCSASCASDAGCPEGGACIALEGDPSRTFFCVERCATSTDCYAGLACTMVEGADGLMGACLP